MKGDETESHFKALALWLTRNCLAPCDLPKATKPGSHCLSVGGLTPESDLLANSILPLRKPSPLYRIQLEASSHPGPFWGQARVQEWTRLSSIALIIDEVIPFLLNLRVVGRPCHISQSSCMFQLILSYSSVRDTNLNPSYPRRSSHRPSYSRSNTCFFL